ncbi:uncharacterized protein PRCAT00005251001 [Priceomyces carsonii]|uniref:uncharacterized protein n=1 Tax=Priceomyces carsonii TaxID=28549 RepID=UPI002ED91A86|nr:unnamed protein product [Priceomyces carsonii]
MVQTDLNGKCALITEASRGIGFFAAEAFILNGVSTLFITSRIEDRCNKSKKLLEDFARDVRKKVEIIPLFYSFLSKTESNKLVSEIILRVPKLDFLLLNADKTFGEVFDKLPMAGPEEIKDMNVAYMLRTLETFVPLLTSEDTEADFSRVIFISSLEAMFATDIFNMQDFAKRNIEAIDFGKKLAIQLGPKNISVSIVPPSLFLNEEYSPILTQNLAGPNSTGTVTAELDHFKNIVDWLCTKQSKYMNGLVLNNDKRKLATTSFNL